MNLLDLRNGEKCRLLGLDNSLSHHDRYLELGFTHGTEICVLRRAPLGDPIQVRVRDTDLAICKSDALCIEVESLTP